MHLRLSSHPRYIIFWKVGRDISKDPLTLVCVLRGKLILIVKLLDIPIEILWAIWIEENL